MDFYSHRSSSRWPFTPIVQLVITWLFLKGLLQFFNILEIQGGTLTVPMSEAAWESCLATFGYLYLIGVVPLVPFGSLRPRPIANA
jgi:hypothetical protein